MLYCITKQIIISYYYCSVITVSEAAFYRQLKGDMSHNNGTWRECCEALIRRRYCQCPSSCSFRSLVFINIFSLIPHRTVFLARKLREKHLGGKKKIQTAFLKTLLKTEFILIHSHAFSFLNHISILVPLPQCTSSSWLVENGSTPLT